jgi:hypothetical protein
MVICISYADQENPKVFEWLEEKDAGYGDQLITDWQDVFIQLAPHECIKILRKQFPDLCVKISGATKPSKRDTTWKDLCKEIYSALESLCLPLNLYQPTEIEENVIMSDKKAPTPAAKAPTAAKAPAAPKEKKATKPRKFEANDTIHFAADKEGKKYGPDHNPKRPGSAAHKVFGMYKEGIKVSDFVKAGGSAGDIAWNVEHGYITVKKAAA